MARVRGGVCFHRLHRCGFCGVPRPPATAARLRCVCCGRFKVKARSEATCAVCEGRGFEALVLFDLTPLTTDEIEAARAAQRALETALAV